MICRLFLKIDVKIGQLFGRCGREPLGFGKCRSFLESDNHWLPVNFKLLTHGCQLPARVGVHVPIGIRCPLGFRPDVQRRIGLPGQGGAKFRCHRVDHELQAVSVRVKELDRLANAVTRRSNDFNSSVLKSLFIGHLDVFVLDLKR